MYCIMCVSEYKVLKMLLANINIEYFIICYDCLKVYLFSKVIIVDIMYFVDVPLRLNM